MKLYYSLGSPTARKVRIVLDEKGLEFESDILNKLRPVDEFKSINPMLMVPVLEDGSLTLFEPCALPSRDRPFTRDSMAAFFPGRGNERVGSS